jgi:DNA-binding NtrC family response regulator
MTVGCYNVFLMTRERARGEDELTHTLKLGDEPTPARCAFVFWPGGAATYELPAQGTVFIGRAPSCVIRVDHPSVSRQHAAIHVVDGVVHVEDLGSSNGTRVSGRRLEAKRREPLPHGSLVEVGLATAVIQASASMPTAPRMQPSALDGKAVTAPTMQRLEELLALVAPARISVILLGETGVGKEVMAGRIHELSPRSGRPLVRLNCAALPEPLLESELFGHERGAFTGAIQRKIGLIETADGGTLFLDEVAELPLATQAKLLRVLESREVTLVGGVSPSPVDVRFIAATNADLDALVARGVFRSDLYYRLQGITLRIPPLRDRRSEIPALVRTFAAQFARAAGRPEPRVSPEAMQRLASADWPGNIRELRNVIERAVVLSAGGTIDAVHLADMDRVDIQRVPEVPPPPSTSRGALGLKDEVEALERQRIVDALQRSGGNQTEAAKVLGISRRMMLARLDAYGLPRPRKR